MKEKNIWILDRFDGENHKIIFAISIFIFFSKKVSIKINSQIKDKTKIRIPKYNTMVIINRIKESIKQHPRDPNNLAVDELFADGQISQIWDLLSKYIKKRFTGQALAGISLSDIIFAYNIKGLNGINKLFRDYLHIHVPIKYTDDEIVPGVCSITKSSKIHGIWKTYEIKISKKYITNPVIYSAILSHELCHIIFDQFIDQTKHRNSSLDNIFIERGTDILIFLLNLDESYLRALSYNIKIGYFPINSLLRLSKYKRGHLYDFYRKL